jgi:hypothetical protein
MTADELRQIAYHEPFRPFRVRLVSGESIEIRRTLRTTVAEDRVVFGTEDDPVTGIARRMRMIALRDISSVEVVEPAR